MGAVIFANYPLVQLDSRNTPFQYGLYDGLSRVGWAVALSYIIFACIHGSGGPVNWFLAHPLWQPLANVSYSIYLLHIPIVLITMASVKTSIYFTELSAYHAFIGNYVITLIASVIATLAIESPLSEIKRIIFSSTTESQQDNEPKNGVRKLDSNIKSSGV